MSSIGRSVRTTARAKHAIKRVDRLLSNQHLHREMPAVFREITRELVMGSHRPVVLIDWTKTVGGMWALAAAVPVDGRALPIYVEVHRQASYCNRAVHDAFLTRVGEVLPPGCRPIVVADAGFGKPFYSGIRRRNWDFVGRLRGRRRVRSATGSVPVRELWSKATTTPRDLGRWWLLSRGRRDESFRLVLVSKRGRKRHPWTKCHAGGTSKVDHDPWLLVSSLPNCSAQQIVSLYRLRMQIEESFRDTKGARFGWCFDHAHCTQPVRATVLFLLAALAAVAVTLVGLAAESANEQLVFQANTVRHRRVLSLAMLGNWILRTRPQREPNRTRIRAALKELQSRVREASSA